MSPNEETKLRQKLVFGAKWIAAIRFASQIITWAVTLAMVRILTPQDYGLNAMIEVPMTLFFLFSTLGIDSAIIHFGKRNSTHLSSIFGLLLLVNGALFLGLLFSADAISEYFREPRLKALIQVSAIIFVMAPFRTIPNALLDISMDFKIKAQVELAAAIISSLAALVLALFGAGVWALVAAMLLSAILKAVLLAYFRPWILRPTFRLEPIKELLKYGSIIMLGDAINGLSGNALSFLAGPQLGAEVLGFYAVARVFSSLPMSKLMPILNQTMFPAFAQLKENPEIAKKYLLKSLEMSAMIIVPLAIGMACISANLVSVVFGDKWKTVALPLAILSALIPIRLIDQIFNVPLNAIGHAKVVTRINICTLIILCLGALTASRFGLLGLVYLSGIAAFVSATISLLVGSKIFNIHFKDFCKVLKPSFIASSIMAMVLITANHFILGSSGLIRLLVEVISGGLIYYLAMFFLFRKTLNEVQGHFV